jgi:hypothetical protein
MSRPKLRATATAATEDKAIELAKQKLKEKASKEKKRLVTDPKEDSTWVQGLFGYGAKVSAEYVDAKPSSPRRLRWRGR